MMKPMVTVVCLAYNHEKYIQKTLEGFVMQKTSFDYKVLIHEDASTDGTLQIIQEYAGKYPGLFEVIEQKENQYSKGVSITEKFLLPRIEGRYVAFCEGDDYWIRPDKLQKQYDFMEQNKGCVISTHVVQCIHENELYMKKTIPSKHFQKKIPKIIDGKMLTHELLVGEFPFHLSSYFIRAAIYKRYCTEKPSYRQKVKTGDVALLQYMALKGDCGFISETMSCYRVGSVQGWTERTKKNASSIIKRYEDALVYLDELDRCTEGKFKKDIQISKNLQNIQIIKIKREYKELFKYRKEIKRFPVKEQIKLVLLFIIDKFSPRIMEKYKNDI